MAHAASTGMKDQAEHDLEDPRHFDRVRARTPDRVNAKIDRKTGAHVRAIGREGREAIIERIHKLDREWDIDRVLALNFDVLGAVAEELGRRGNRVFMGVFRAQQVFMLMHVAIGWCPPTSVLRRLGVRTAKEIAAERQSLVALLELSGDDDIDVRFDQPPATATSEGTSVKW
jgi:hypothetical protein